MDSLKGKLEKQRSAVKLIRSTWEPLWRELDQWVLPDRCQFNLTDVNQGQIRTTSIIDSTPTLATRTLEAGLMSGMTSPARPWVKLTTEDPDLAKSAAVRGWLEECSNRILQAFRSSNLYQVLPTCYGNCGVFGTDAIWFDEVFGEDHDDVFRFYPQPIGSYWLAAGPTGEVDTIFREIHLSVRQMVAKFGIDKVSPSIKSAYENCNYENMIPVVHAVLPNPDHNPRKSLAKFKRFVSLWYEMSSTADNNFLSESGYDEFPALCPRWQTTGMNVYGFGAGRMILGDAKALQAYERRTAEAVAKEVNPPLLAPSFLRGNEVQTIPGGITFYDESQATQGVRSLFEMKFPYAGAESKGQQCRLRITRGLFEDLFLMLANSDRRQVTAEEIRAKQEEKMLAIGPVLERLNDELLDPLVERAFSILLRRGRLPPPPPEIAGQQIAIEYVSILGQVQKMLGLGAIDRVLGVVGNMASVDPTVADKINRDRVVDLYVDLVGAPTKILNDDKEVANIRQNRAAAMQKQQQQVDLAGQAQTAQVLSKTDTRGDNGLSELIRSQSGSFQ